MYWGIRALAATAIASVAVALGAGVAVGAGQTYSTKLIRGKGRALILKVSSAQTIQSYSFELKKSEQKTYNIPKADLAKANGQTVKSSSYYHTACSPAQIKNGYPLEKPPGNGVVCGFSTGLPPNAKSLVIDFTTNKCLPANAIVGIKGPSGGCKT